MPCHPYVCPAAALCLGFLNDPHWLSELHSTLFIWGLFFPQFERISLGKCVFVITLTIFPLIFCFFFHECFFAAPIITTLLKIVIYGVVQQSVVTDER